MGKQDVGDLEEIRVGIESWIRQRRPDREGLRIGALDFPEASGESSVTLLLDAHSDRFGDERFVLRMAPAESQVFDAHDLLMQYQMMEVMHAEGIPAPGLVGYEPDAAILGSDFYVMEFTEGRVAPDNPPFAMAGWVKEDLSDADRAAMWESGQDTLAKIHRIDPAAHDLSRLPCAKPGEPPVAQEVRTFDAMWKPELRPKADPLIAEGWAQLLDTIPADGEPGLCWGDSRIGNVIYRGLTPAAIIDWEMANISDPLTDLAWWVWIDRCNSEGLNQPRLGGLPAPAAIYERWHKATGRSIDRIAWFELFAVVRFAIILERKFDAISKLQPELGRIPNYTTQFIPELMRAARA